MNSLFSYSITLSSFQKMNESDTKTLENISSCGFKNIEMFGEPEKIDLQYYKEMLSTFDLNVSGITGMWGKSSQSGWKRRLLSKDHCIVKHAEKYVRSCIDMCGFIGGKVFNICLFSDPIEYLDVTHNNIIKNEKDILLKRCVPLLRLLSDYAMEQDVKIVLEPLNRYSTPYCCNCEDAKIILQDCDNLFLMLDTFHMNIEEDDFVNTIVKSKDKLSHMHFADNNRKMPGEGHIDFKNIISALKSINYDHFISFEPTISQTTNYNEKIRAGFDFIKNLDSTIK
ncbi:sugar phosphate isomerase/epimerase family protein [Candidatus Nitrosocosmicus agrestis]|uniref:sugar phosphate isomerase/epimerase family protein n=1 Tax=Candidatus Nitrosocosmicus agrestis TaxID=2563600 RepID=UPI00122E01A3|nr:sugar phosphate isomerase/epimerase [Candidatus Nitrosocosmicus sp. SS]KAA2279365.1 sugar phosphate isomerase/epimerase [Candidatus Nitrosocosmicus sp. SS]KAF0867858.1 sugar phosphate isomerase/epimerase [Candidatus Nitrosocosmicus sp. SS]